jgi:hypothetical protein
MADCSLTHSLVALWSDLLLDHVKSIVNSLVEVSWVLQVVNALFKSESEHHAGNFGGVFSVDRGDLTVDKVTDKLLLCLHVSLGAHVVHGQLCEWVLLHRHRIWLHYLSHHLGCLLLHRLSWCLLRQRRAHFRECLLVENRLILLRPLVLIPGLVIWLVLWFKTSLLTINYCGNAAKWSLPFG